MSLGEKDEVLRSFLTSRLAPLGSAHEVNWILDFLKSKTNPPLTAEDIIDRREAGEPLPYIFGSWAFRTHEFFVGPGVLIPRPETEELVDFVLQWFKGQNMPYPIIGDFGAGSGAIGLSLASEFPGIHTHLVERSSAAHFWLKKNIQAWELKVPHSKTESKLYLHETSWTELKDISFDCIVSNPPYVTQKEYELCDESVRKWEPFEALVPEDIQNEPSGIGCYLSILDVAERLLKVGGAVFFELGLNQSHLLNDEISRRKHWNSPEYYYDMAGKLRFAKIVRSF
jgi:release factor glutamine methyltransferase